MLPPPPPPPSNGAAFLRRALSGDWGGALRAAVWPLVFLAALAFALAVPSYGQDMSDDDAVGFGDRFQITLALVLQGVGGDLEAETSRTDRSDDIGPGEDWDSARPGEDSYGYEPTLSEQLGVATSSMELIPFTVTAGWLLTLYAGLRLLRDRDRRRLAAGATATAAPGTGPPAGAWAGAAPWTQGATSGLEAALRVGLLVTAGVLVLALFAQPTIQGVALSSGAPFAVLGALLLSLVLSAVVLARDEHTGWLAARPGLQALTRACGTALRAMTFALALCSVVLLIVYTQLDEFDEGGSLYGEDFPTTLTVALLLLNLGVAGLGLSWGAPVEAEFSSRLRPEEEALGLSELGDLVGSWAVAGTLAVGAVSVLFLGVLAARRHERRAEQLLAGGLFLGLFLLLAGIGGYGMTQGAPTGSYRGGEEMHVGTAIPDALLFGTLWVAGGLLAGALLVSLLRPPPAAR
ncbi:zinc ribbon domain-containing protein [Streptomyces uncialis]|uniref:zinc ribbon domain-containing protein n=1 Tax=Streptomyces uncialis TaxID=1048205 RepID=UPI0033D5260D